MASPHHCSSCGRAYCFGSGPDRLNCSCCERCFLGECEGPKRRGAAPSDPTAPSAGRGEPELPPPPAAKKRARAHLTGGLRGGGGGEDLVAEALRPFHPRAGRRWVAIGAEQRSALDGARDKVRAWLEANPEWKDRVTNDGLEKYRTFSHDPSLYGIDLVLNNPAVALWLGLSEVFEHQIDMGIDPTANGWEGLYCTAYDNNLVRIALVRGDAKLMTQFLDCDDFEFQNLDVLWNILSFILTSDWLGDVDRSCRRAFLRHAKVYPNLDHVGKRVGEPSRTASLQSLFELRDHMRKRSQQALEEKERRVEAILELLKAGADAFYKHVNGDCPANFVRRRIEGTTVERNRKTWRQILKLMEALPDPTIRGLRPRKNDDEKMW